MLAGVHVDVDEALGLDEALGTNFGTLRAIAAAMERDSRWAGLVRTTSTDSSSIIAPMIFSICCVHVSLPSMSYSRPGVVCWPVMAVVLLSRMT
jgi:hypothetical protein